MGLGLLSQWEVSAEEFKEVADNREFYIKIDFQRSNNANIQPPKRRIREFKLIFYFIDMAYFICGKPQFYYPPPKADYPKLKQKNLTMRPTLRNCIST